MNALLTSTPTTATDARIATLSESDLTPLLTAWDQAHPAVAVMDLDWRHLLDEIAHPHTTQAFHRLAEAAA
ncbi:hypothetical protein ACH4TV_16655 [Streptomyces sp. NPDC020898]|uniref:hypothetical protein n=1 Tax=Streptomyces sp. NPDC020898 TaxID=3365101 RepID=UPI0037B3802C